MDTAAVGSTVEVTGENFKQLVERDGIVLLDWWAAWCGPCRSFAPTFEKAARAHPDIVFGKVDTEAQQELAASFQIRSSRIVAMSFCEPRSWTRVLSS